MRSLVSALLFLTAIGGGTLWLLGPVVDVDPVGPDASVAVLVVDRSPVAVRPDLPPTLTEATAVELEVPSAAESSFSVHLTALRPTARGSDVPAKGCTFELGVSGSLRDPGDALMAVQTDEKGHAYAELPWSAVATMEDVEQPIVWARAERRDLFRRLVSAPIPVDAVGPILLEALPAPGSVVEGILLGPGGEPVVGRVEPRCFGKEFGSYSPAGWAFAGPDGRFRAVLHREGAYGFLAMGTSDRRYSSLSDMYSEKDVSFDLGTGVYELPDVRFDEPNPFLEIRVSGAGVIRGRVLDDSGAAAAGLRIAVFRVAGAEARGGQFANLGGGHLSSYSVTDGSGAFEFVALRDGLFHVRADLGSLDEDYALVVTEKPVPSHGQLLQLRFTRPHLAIHVRHADGSLPGDELKALETHSWLRSWQAAAPWPDEPRLLVALASDTASARGRTAPQLSARKTGPGEFIVELPDDVSVDVGALGEAMPWAPRQVRVPAGAGRVDVDVVMPPAGAVGWLRLEVENGAGPVPMSELRVRIADPDHGTVLWDSGPRGAGPTKLSRPFEIPAGDYRLLVEGRPLYGYHGVEKQRIHGGYRTSLHIAPGAETRVRVFLEGGARLALRILGEPNEDDLDVGRAMVAEGWSLSNLLEASDEARARAFAMRVELRLEHEASWPEAVEFRTVGLYANGLLPTLDMGGSGTSTVLTPGHYTLVATSPGGRTTRRELELVAGQTLDVTLVFD